MDPKKAGAACCMGDIGTHAENLARYITGLEIDELCADLTGFIAGNPLDDDGNVLIHYQGGARGVLFASQISSGEENGLRIRAYGSTAGFEWRQEDPNFLIVKDPAGFQTVYSKGNPCLCPEARAAGRLPCGHPDGFIEAFANIYREVYKGIRAQAAGKKIPVCDHPTVNDGVIGLSFIEAVVASSRSRTWMKLSR
jgi:predicted dehydrogenase